MLSAIILQAIVLLARGGGGGSSSGGGGGGFSGGSHSYSSGSSSGASGPWWLTLLIYGLIFGVILALYLMSRKNKFVGLTKRTGFIDPKNDIALAPLASRVEKVFYQFQQAWSEFDMAAMKQVVTTDYLKRMTLELTVLKNYQRQNKMNNVKLVSCYIKPQKDGFVAQITGSATDQLIDLATNKVIFTDNSNWTEFWTFTKIGTTYMLSGIAQSTEDATKTNQTIAGFAEKHGYFFDPDFGWLMMPSRGAIFSAIGFGKADINNHVIGYFRDIVVEYYSYEPKAGTGQKPFLVAQAILPKRYSDILVTMKGMYDFKPKGLRRIEMEDPDFNKKFAVWADSADAATSFELLATNFMTRIYDLPFEINIEVIDNVLYFFATDTSVQYDKLQDVLVWAFNEMKL